MERIYLTRALAPAPQIAAADRPALRARGFRAMIVNRPDGEGADQPGHAEIEAAARAEGMDLRYVPVTGGMIGDADVAAFDAALRELPGPVLAYCRSGMRSATLWALSQAGHHPLPKILQAAKGAGHGLSGLARRIAGGGRMPTAGSNVSHGIVIIGAGAARQPALRQGHDSAIAGPAQAQTFRPGWSRLGAASGRSSLAA